MKDNIHTLILPDIHGRTFWKEALAQFPIDRFPNIDIVFLGDYLDPYSKEEISREDVIFNFEDIIKLKRSDKRVKLLLGNHDFHYFYNARYKARVDEINYNYIKNLFESNIEIFDIAYENVINDQRYLYTHAGCTKYWVDHVRFMIEITLNNIKRGTVGEDREEFVQMLIDFIPTIKQLNAMKNDFQGQALLWSCSWIRGGDYQNGSCLWADLEEWQYTNANIENVFQIFGHSLFGTSDINDVFIDNEKKIAMLDNRQAWILTENNELKQLTFVKYS